MLRQLFKRSYALLISPLVRKYHSPFIRNDLKISLDCLIKRPDARAIPESNNLQRLDRASKSPIPMLQAFNRYNKRFVVIGDINLNSNQSWEQPWTSEEIETLIRKIFNTLDCLESLELEYETLKPSDIAIDPERYFLKVYNFFGCKSNQTQRHLSSKSAVICTIAKALYPKIVFQDQDHCSDWMKRHHPEIIKRVEEVQKEIGQIRMNSKKDSTGQS